MKAVEAPYESLHARYLPKHASKLQVNLLAHHRVLNPSALGALPPFLSRVFRHTRFASQLSSSVTSAPVRSRELGFAGPMLFAPPRLPPPVPPRERADHHEERDVKPMAAKPVNGHSGKGKGRASEPGLYGSQQSRREGEGTARRASSGSFSVGATTSAAGQQGVPQASSSSVIDLTGDSDDEVLAPVPASLKEDDDDCIIIDTPPAGPVSVAATRKAVAPSLHSISPGAPPSGNEALLVPKKRSPSAELPARPKIRRVSTPHKTRTASRERRRRSSSFAAAPPSVSPPPPQHERRAEDQPLDKGKGRERSPTHLYPTPEQEAPAAKPEPPSRGLLVHPQGQLTCRPPPPPPPLPSTETVLLPLPLLLPVLGWSDPQLQRLMDPPPALAPSVTAGALNFRLSPPPQIATQFGALRPPPPPPPAVSSVGTPLRRRSSIAASLTSSPAASSTPKPRLAIPHESSAAPPAAEEGRDQPSSPRWELIEPEFHFHQQRLAPSPGSREVREEEYDQAVDSKCRGWPGRAELREGKQGGGEQGFQGEIETRGWEIAGLGEMWKAVGGGGTVWRGLPGLPTRQMGIEGAEEEARREEEERIAGGDAGDEFGYARAVRRHRESLERRQAWGPPLRRKKVGKGARRGPG